MPADAALSTAMPAQQPVLRNVVLAATVGNVLEWFDFLVYGYFAVVIAEVFFPAGNPTVSLLVTFGAFGLSYLARPLGAIVIGAYTDRAGRKAGLTLSIALMMIGTAMMASRQATLRSVLPRRCSSRVRALCKGSQWVASSEAPWRSWPSMGPPARASVQAGSGQAQGSFP
jgi:MFS family permease